MKEKDDAKLISEKAKSYSEQGLTELSPSP